MSGLLTQRESYLINDAVTQHTIFKNRHHASNSLLKLNSSPSSGAEK